MALDELGFSGLALDELGFSGLEHSRPAVGFRINRHSRTPEVLEGLGRTLNSQPRTRICEASEHLACHYSLEP